MRLIAQLRLWHGHRYRQDLDQDDRPGRQCEALWPNSVTHHSVASRPPANAGGLDVAERCVLWYHQPPWHCPPAVCLENYIPNCAHSRRQVPLMLHWCASSTTRSTVRPGSGSVGSTMDDGWALRKWRGLASAPNPTADQRIPLHPLTLINFPGYNATFYGRRHPSFVRLKNARVWRENP